MGTVCRSQGSSEDGQGGEGKASPKTDSYGKVAGDKETSSVPPQSFAALYSSTKYEAKGLFVALQAQVIKALFSQNCSFPQNFFICIFLLSLMSTGRLCLQFSFFFKPFLEKKVLTAKK